MQKTPNVSSWTSEMKKASAHDLEICTYVHVHSEKVQQIQELLPDEVTLNRLSELFNVFGDNTRIRILYVLFEDEVCVCDLANLLGMTQSAVSHQLRVLKDARLIKSRRDGKTVFYSLADDHVRSLLSQGTDHIHEEL